MTDSMYVRVETFPEAAHRTSSSSCSELCSGMNTFRAWIMHPLILILLLAEGTCEGLYWQKLTCPFELEHESLLRVWCRQDSADCCTGLTFSQTSANMEEDMDEGQLKVTQGPDFFTMAVLEPSLGNGIYWCGVLSQNNTMIKLAERYFHSSPGVYIWSFTRWILLPLLPLTTIFTNIYTRAMRKCKFEEEKTYDDIDVSRPLAVPVNAASVCELE